jgi:hypothetical protein
MAPIKRFDGIFGLQKMTFMIHLLKIASLFNGDRAWLFDRTTLSCCPTPDVFSKFERSRLAQ